jgi:hypothetical protein
LIAKLIFAEQAGQNVILIELPLLCGLIEKQQFQLQHTIIMETGGMKGRRNDSGATRSIM